MSPSPATADSSVRNKSCQAPQVRRAIDHSLKCWGLDSTTNPRHAKFCRKAQQVAALYANTKNASPLTAELLAELSEQQFPMDYDDAVVFVLRSTLSDFDDDDTLTEATDTLDSHFAPYYLYKDRRTGAQKYRKLSTFERYKASQLDPLTRFTFEQRPWNEMAYLQWQDHHSLGGQAMEALIACHSIHHVACYACHRRGSLRHNGGIDLASSWADLVCLDCRATYEIKSKKDLEALEKSWKFGFGGGSFRTLASYAHAGKRFLVATSRCVTVGRRGERQHPVYVVEIDHVLPCLQEDSFDESCEHMPFATEIVTVGSKQMRECLWFHMPAMTIDLRVEAIRLYDERFGQGEWENMKARLENDEKPSSPQDLAKKSPDANTDLLEKSEDDGKPKNFEGLRQALDDLRVADADEEDWDNLYDSE